MPSVSLPNMKAVACLQLSLISRYAISLELSWVFDLALSVASEILCSESVLKASMSDSHPNNWAFEYRSSASFYD